MDITGFSLVAGQRTCEGGRRFEARNPASGETIGPAFFEARREDIDRAASEAGHAFDLYRLTSGADRAAFLESIAKEIEAIGDALIERAQQETGLPLARLTGERARTCGQLRLFAEVLREGSWVDARIDRALPQRTPLPRPDLRRRLVALGPVAVFGASNFPLAFSVAGGDTASALAAGCPVVVKAHPAHPGTSELVGAAIGRAVQGCGLPGGVFSLLHGGAETGVTLVRHPAICGAGFTGSHTAGRALFDAAAARPHPIPVFSEMSSINPLLVLPGALAERGEAIAAGLAASVSLGVGQFCTKPGLVFIERGAAGDAWINQLALKLKNTAAGVMLTPEIRARFEAKRQELSGTAGVEFSVRGAVSGVSEVSPDLAITSAADFRREPGLSQELFGPHCLIVRYESEPELAACLEGLDGQLTATVHFGAQETESARQWVERLQRKAGRVLCNGFPTGVEVCAAMNHGGPYPATSDARFTSVGTAAIFRFVRPVCLQNFPPELLPPVLRNENPLGILRQVDGVLTRDPIGS